MALNLNNKSFVIILSAGFFSTLFEFIHNLVEKYVFADWEFMFFLAILLVIDTVTGLMVGYRRRNITSKGFANLFRKLIIYFVILVLTHIVTNYKVQGEPNILLGWFDNFVYAALIIREAISILENLGILYPALLPRGILSRLKQFDKNGKYND